MIDGVKVSMGGVDYIVPPLTLKSLRKLESGMNKLVALASGGPRIPDTEQLAIVQQVVYEALRRNYPEMTPERVEELLDIGNMPTALAAVMAVSLKGLPESKPGESAAP